MSNRALPLAGILLLSAGAALAQATPPPATPPASTAPAKPDAKPETVKPDAAKSDTSKMSEYEAVKVVKSTLAKAIETAESKDGQGRAIDADFEQPSGDLPVRWEVKVVYPDGRLVEHFINADTGAVIKSENQPFERYFTRLKVEDFQKATTPLKDALAIAEKKAGGGKAYEAEVEYEGDTVAYDISVAGADKSSDVKVGHDGKVIGD